MWDIGQLEDVFAVEDIDKSVCMLIKKLEQTKARATDMLFPENIPHVSAIGVNQQLCLSGIEDLWRSGKLGANSQDGRMNPVERRYFFYILTCQKLQGNITEIDLFEPKICKILERSAIHDIGHIWSLIKIFELREVECVEAPSVWEFLKKVMEKASDGPHKPHDAPRELNHGKLNTDEDFWSNGNNTPPNGALNGLAGVCWRH